MANENPDTKPKEQTPFQKFEAWARKIVNVPKSRVDKARDDEKRSRAG